MSHRMPALPALLAKAVLTARGRSGTSLPAEPLRFTGITIEPQRVYRYAKVCGFPVSEQVPPTFPYVLGFPAQVAYMAQPAFPLPMPGLVHTENRIRVGEPLVVGQRVDVTAWAEDLRDHRAGTVVDLHVQLTASGDPDAEPVWSGVSTYLARSNRSAATDHAAERVEPVPGPPVAVWRLGADTGRRYAGVSGDINPIHLSGVSARLFGFRHGIAHGMQVHARAVAWLTPRLPRRPLLQASFHRPVPLPSTVALHRGSTPGETVIDVVRKDRLLARTVVGSIG